MRKEMKWSKEEREHREASKLTAVKMGFGRQIESNFFFTCDNFVASLTKLISSRPRDSSEIFLLGFVRLATKLSQVTVNFTLYC